MSSDALPPAGTEAFPDENEYSRFLSDHGGSSNAYTASQVRSCGGTMRGCVRQPTASS